MRLLQRFVLVGLLALLSNVATAADQAMIVLDASGSMWGQIDGKPKLQIAREALATVLESVPADMELGLIAYGHREKGNCKDIELIVEPAAGTGPAIAQAAAKMKFLGKTPLTASVKQAAEVLRYTEEKATVILITDGLENCSADPCALGAELASQGIDFTAHVVGFDLTDAEGKQVACLAESTGGKYLAASNADQLRAALLSTVIEPTKKVEPEAKKEEPLVLPKATLTPDETVSIGDDVQVSWTGPNAEHDYIDIVPHDYKDTHGELSYTYTKDGSPLSVRAPGKPGEYKVRYIWRGTDDKRHVLAEAALPVTDSEVALVAPSTVQAGSFVPVKWKGPANEGDYIDLVPQGFKRTGGELSYAYTGEKPEIELRAPAKPGNFEIRYVLKAPDKKRVLATVPLEVTEAVATLSIPETIEAGAVLPVFWTGPAGEKDYVDLVPADHKRIGGELTYFYTASSEDGETGELTVPTKPGPYLVRYVLRGSGADSVVASQPFTVTAAEASVKAPESVEAGSKFEVEWTGPAGEKDYIDLVPADHKRIGGEITYFYTKPLEAGEPGELKAPTKAGQYLVRYVLKGSGAGSVIASQPLTVTVAEANVKAPESVEAGSKFEVEWTGPAGEKDYIDLVPADHKRIGGEITYFYTKPLEAGEPGELKAPTKAGQYLVRYVLKGSGAGSVIARQPLTVTAAEASVKAPESVEAGSKFDVAWTGPAGEKDYIDLVPADHKRVGGHITHFTPKSLEAGEPGEMKAPTKAGQYLVRYVLKGSGAGSVIARQPLTVTAAEASVKTPESVEAGSKFEVEWTGPAGEKDYIDLVPADHKRVGGHITHFTPKSLEAGEPGEMKAPTKAGQYLVRYILQGSGPGSVIATHPFKVTAAD
ncbi:VWA domain-containing protein [Alcaligenaceae bacterium]|nr:VWA domain-containing protein [Alcaligenaceae bacterium]